GAGGCGSPPWRPCRRRRGGGQRALSIICASWALPTAPIWVACTWPSLNSRSIGIERTWYFIAVARLWSTLTLATFTLPAYSSASWSRAGAIIRHGPHHSAQKSTSTGSDDCRTAVSKSASPTCMTLSLTELTPAGIAASTLYARGVARRPGRRYVRLGCFATASRPPHAAVRDTTLADPGSLHSQAPPTQARLPRRCHPAYA